MDQRFPFFRELWASTPGAPFLPTSFTHATFLKTARGLDWEGRLHRRIDSLRGVPPHGCVRELRAPSRVSTRHDFHPTALRREPSYERTSLPVPLLQTQGADLGRANTAIGAVNDVGSPSCAACLSTGTTTHILHQFSPNIRQVAV